jgi:hypothetical protein
LAWLPAPLDTVLDSLPKCAPRARLKIINLFTYKHYPIPKHSISHE